MISRSKILSCVVSLFSSAYATYWGLFMDGTPLQEPVREHTLPDCLHTMQSND